MNFLVVNNAVIRDSFKFDVHRLEGWVLLSNIR